jgi:hypothetical protein
MTPDEIAERFALRPGYRLIDYLEVGLPVYHVVLQASTLLRKKIPPLEEFVMRCLKLGMRDCQEVSSFLGLELETVESVVTSLIQDNDVSLAGIPEANEQALKLTVKGLKTIEELETVIPEDKTLSLHFDALLRRPAFYREELLKYRQLREEGLKEIPAIPARQPKEDDFPVSQVQSIIKYRMGAGEKRDLLLVKRVERCNRLFRRAIALLFRSLEGDESHVEFVVDGKPTTEYDLAFAKADGLKLLGIEVPQSEQGISGTLPIGEQSRPQPVGDIPVQDAVIQAEADAALVANARVLETEEAIERSTDPTTRELLKNQLQEAQEQVANLEAERKRRRVRQVYVYEHPRLLERALNSCQERLMIISPWIRAQVVDREFLGKLKDTIKRKVKVYIGYGISDEKSDDFRKADRVVEERLAALAARYSNFVFRRFGDTHAKVLICDSKFCVTGSFNWLSFRGDSDRTFRDEQSVLVEIPEHVNGVFCENLKRFEAQPSAHDRK